MLLVLIFYFSHSSYIFVIYYDLLVKNNPIFFLFIISLNMCFLKYIVFIFQVINMILATQEHSPLFVVQALDRVLDILRSTDIYSPQFTGLRQNHAEDQVASDLFSGLVSV